MLVLGEQPMLGCLQQVVTCIDAMAIYTFEHPGLDGMIWNSSTEPWRVIRLTWPRKSQLTAFKLHC